MQLFRSCTILLLLFICCAVCAQDTSMVIDSIPQDSLVKADSLKVDSASPVIPAELKKTNWRSLVDNNSLINFKSASENYIQKERKFSSGEFLFYLILGIFFFFGFLRILYSRYIGIVFRVFFNTSLRQSQLTDQLLQSKLPSMLFNLFFCIMGGLYVFLLLRFYNLVHQDELQLLGFLILSITLIYLTKFIVLKFTGWVSGYKQEIDSYIFIVFLINKILAIILMPVVLIIAFADSPISYITVILSYFIIILLYLLRYLRSYSVLQRRLNINRFHFLLYIAGVEIIPLMLTYKIAERLLTIYL